MKATLTTLLNIILLENLSRERKVGGGGQKKEPLESEAGQEMEF